MKLNQQIGAFTILIVLIINLFASSYILISFKINQNYIANTICVEKDKEVNTCQGSCHLKKQFDKIEEKEDTDNKIPEFKETHVTHYFYQSTHVISMVNSKIQEITFTDTPNNTLLGVKKLCFKPPKAII